MSAREITKALAGTWHGSYGMTCCPAHDDCDPSLSIKDGDAGILVFCHAGCPQDAVIDALKAQGLWPNRNPDIGSGHPGIGGQGGEIGGQIDIRHEQQAEAAKRSQAALDIWRTATLAKGSLVEVYLRSRGITLGPPL